MCPTHYQLPKPNSLQITRDELPNSFAPPISAVESRLKCSIKNSSATLAILLGAALLRGLYRIFIVPLALLQIDCARGTFLYSLFLQLAIAQ